MSIAQIERPTISEHPQIAVGQGLVREAWGGGEPHGSSWRQRKERVRKPACQEESLRQ